MLLRTESQGNKAQSLESEQRTDQKQTHSPQVLDVSDADFKTAILYTHTTLHVYKEIKYLQEKLETYQRWCNILKERTRTSRTEKYKTKVKTLVVCIPQSRVLISQKNHWKKGSGVWKRGTKVGKTGKAG